MPVVKVWGVQNLLTDERAKMKAAVRKALSEIRELGLGPERIRVICPKETDEGSLGIAPVVEVIMAARPERDANVRSQTVIVARLAVQQHCPPGTFVQSYICRLVPDEEYSSTTRTG